jgi:hypothetical protein
MKLRALIRDSCVPDDDVSRGLPASILAQVLLMETILWKADTRGIPESSTESVLYRIEWCSSVNP